VWQLLRLGLLRDRGKPVVEPQEWFIQPVGSAKWHVKDFPEDWDELPPIVQVKPKADPFSAYQTLSVLGSRFLAIESAVQTILQRVDIDDAVRRQVIERSDGERISLPHEVGERVAYVFLTGNRAG
jgi:hypothetical protein